MKEKIKNIIQEEISASICECVLGPHTVIDGIDEAVNRIYEMLQKESA